MSIDSISGKDLFKTGEALKVFAVSTNHMHECTEDFVKCPDAYENQSAFINAFIAFVFCNRVGIEKILNIFESKEFKDSELYQECWQFVERLSNEN